MSERPRFRPGEMLRALTEGGVRFVLIGGLAANAHGSPSLTADVDICHDLDKSNLERLASVLRDLGAVRRDTPDGVLAPIDARALRLGDVFTLRTRHGSLDLLAHPEPGLSYEALAANALETQLSGSVVMIAGLDDLMAMKRAAGSPKDLIELEVLGALREEIDRRR